MTETTKARFCLVFCVRKVELALAFRLFTLLSLNREAIRHPLTGSINVNCHFKGARYVEYTLCLDASNAISLVEDNILRFEMLFNAVKSRLRFVGLAREDVNVAGALVVIGVRLAGLVHAFQHAVFRTQVARDVALHDQLEEGITFDARVLAKPHEVKALVLGHLEVLHEVVHEPGNGLGAIDFVAALEIHCHVLSELPVETEAGLHNLGSFANAGLDNTAEDPFN